MTAMMTTRAVRMAKRRESTARAEFVGATDIRVLRGEVGVDERVITDERGRVVGRSRGDVVRTRLYRIYRNGDLHKDRDRAEAMYAAGERFARLVETAESAPFRSNLNRDFYGQRPDAPIISRASERRADANSELGEVEKAVGNVLLPILFCVCIDGAPADEWAKSVGKPARHGIAALCLALEALVEYWKVERR